MPDEPICNGSDGAVAPGCGSSSPKPEEGPPNVPDEPICDGSDQLRVRFFYEPQFDRELLGNAVLVELGNSSIGIDGRCRYWINGGWTNGRADRHLPWKVGEISPDLAAELDAAINLRTLDALECEGLTSIANGNAYTIRSQYSRRGCKVGLDATEFYDVYRILNDRGPELYAAATLMDGPMHLVMLGQAWPLMMQYDWPVEDIPIDSVSTGLEPGQSLLVSDPEHVRLMRQLRDEYLADVTAPGAENMAWPNGIPLSAGVEIFMRDAVPYC